MLDYRTEAGSLSELWTFALRRSGFSSGFFSPLVPYNYSLPNDLEVFFGGHRDEMGVNRKE